MSAFVGDCYCRNILKFRACSHTPLTTDAFAVILGRMTAMTCQCLFMILQQDRERYGRQKQIHWQATAVHNSGSYSIWYSLICARKAEVQQYVSAHSAPSGYLYECPFLLMQVLHMRRKSSCTCLLHNTDPAVTCHTKVIVVT